MATRPIRTHDLSIVSLTSHRQLRHQAIHTYVHYCLQRDPVRLSYHPVRVKMLRLRSRVLQLSSGCGADMLSGLPLQSQSARRLCPRLFTQRRYATAASDTKIDYRPIKKLLVANRGQISKLLLSGCLTGLCLLAFHA